jgi:replicative DNA helicase
MSSPDLHGKLPPQNINSELYVLGAILLEKNAILKVIDFLRSEHFYKPEHQIIYNGLTQVFKDGKQIDSFILIETLKRSKLLVECGGPAYILELSQNLGSSTHITDHAQIIVEAYMQREIIRVGGEMQNKSFDNEDIEKILEFASDSIINIDNVIQNSETLNIDQAIEKSIEELQNEQKSVKTYFPSLDDKLRIRPQNLILLAARPSQGKTALALNIALNVSKVMPVGFFSLEMSFNELSFRLLSNVSGVPFDHFLNKLSKPSLEKVKIGAEKMRAENKLYINDSGGLTLSKLRAKMTELKLKYGVGLIIVDYLQLMHSQGENQNIRIGNISRGLKLLAKDFDIPILVLSQLSREIEKRTDKRPVLSDLRDSGSLEQDADTVLFLTNYHKSKIYNDGSGNPISEGMCSIDCEKQRNGQTFNCELLFTGKYQRFEDLSENFSDISDIEIDF